MKVKELLQGIECKIIGNGEVEVTGIAYDSRKVKKGDLFFCIKGYSADGHRYAQKAVEAGAVCLMVSEVLDLDVVQIVVEDDRKAMAVISAAFYGKPAEKLTMIGVTGTSGKTSTTYMIKSALEAAGQRVGLIGTIQTLIGEKILPAEHTTPESPDLQKILAGMLMAGMDTVVMEVSSHSLYLDRVYGIEFAGGVFTNLSQDHLDFHGDFEHYFLAKTILFGHCERAVINIDDPYGRRMLEYASGERLTFGFTPQADIYADKIRFFTDSSIFCLHKGEESFEIRLNMPGRFMVDNALAAFGICLMLGADPAHIKEGLESVNYIPGRVENLNTYGRNFSIVLDYCHKPEPLENVLNMIKGYAKGRVVCIFGCGGNRDAAKRPIMGKIAENIADFCIVTSDNPRFEDPYTIINDILAGMEKDNHIVVEDRKKAIKYAIEHAQPGDVILLAGKGHEDYQEIKGVHYPFDEKRIVKEILEELES